MIPVRDDRIVFLGDSITEQQLYTNYVETYLASRFPKLALTFANAGWGGDTSPGGMQRLERDVLSLKPTLVTLCYGMNDGRYTVSTRSIVADYEAGLRELISRLKAAGVRVVVLTPGVVDYDRNPSLQACDYNQGLRVLADVALRVAEEAEVPAYDLHRLMLEVQSKAKAAYPKYTMISDSVHPDPAGHLVMAYGLLEALGVPPRGGEIVVDAVKRTSTGGGVRKAKVRCTTDALALEFHLEELPFFVPASAASILPFLPFRERFDGLRLKVTGLEGEHWQVSSGGQRRPVGKAELEEGIALADIAGSAPYRCAAAVHTFTCEKDRMYFMGWRQLALQGSNGPGYNPAAHRIQAEACRRLDRCRDKVIATKGALRLEMSLVRTESGTDTVAEGDFLTWWRLWGPISGGPLVDHLGGEAAFSAAPSLDSAWKAEVIDMTSPGNNLNALIGPMDNCVAYALAIFDSPCDQEADLLIGSDDGAAAWCNGELIVHNLEVARGCTVDQDCGRVRLRSGRNHLLVKIGQFGGGWGFALRFRGLKHPVHCRFH